MDFLKIINDPECRKNYKKLAYSTIIKDLYDNNIYGIDRAKDLTFHEDEKVFREISPFIPGCFYIFSHESEILKSLEKQKEFHDVIPIFLCLSIGSDKQSRRFVFGINFNILTIPIRAAILQELYNMDKSFFNTINIQHYKGKHPYSKTIVASFAPDNGVKFCEYICSKYKIKKDSIAFRKYFLENITKCRLIDYWQWKYLPFLDIGKGIRGIELAELQKESIN